MASLPALPSLTALRRKPDAQPAADAPPTDADVKLRVARRLQAEDEARRSTSVAPPPAR